MGKGARQMKNEASLLQPAQAEQKRNGKTPHLEWVSQDAKPLFHPFNWHGDRLSDTGAGGVTLYRDGDFAEKVKDIAGGIEIALQLVNEDGTTAAFEEPRLLGEYSSGKLLRFAIAAASMLEQLADQNIESRCKDLDAAKQQKQKRGKDANPP